MIREENEFLLVSSRQRILRYNLLNPAEGMQELPIPKLEAVIALDFDLERNCILWSDAKTKKIMVFNS